MPDNGKKVSTATYGIQEIVTEEASEDRIEILVGILGHAAAKLEHLNRCFDRLENKVMAMRKDVVALRQTIEVIEGQTSGIPAIKELLLEALMR
jgi:hypothetical protein